MRLKKKNLIQVYPQHLKWPIYLKQQLKIYLHFLIIPRSVKTVPAFVERHNVIASSAKVNLVGAGNNPIIKDVEEFDTTDFVDEGDLSISIPPFASYYMCYFSK